MALNTTTKHSRTEQNWKKKNENESNNNNNNSDGMKHNKIQLRAGRHTDKGTKHEYNKISKRYKNR